MIKTIKKLHNPQAYAVLTAINGVVLLLFFKEKFVLYFGYSLQILFPILNYIYERKLYVSLNGFRIISYWLLFFTMITGLGFVLSFSQDNVIYGAELMGIISIVSLPLAALFALVTLLLRRGPSLRKGRLNVIFYLMIHFVFCFWFLGYHY